MHHAYVMKCFPTNTGHMIKMRERQRAFHDNAINAFLVKKESNNVINNCLSVKD